MVNEIKSGDLVKTRDGYFGIVFGPPADAGVVFLGNGTRTIEAVSSLERVMLPNGISPCNFSEILGEELSDERTPLMTASRRDWIDLVVRYDDLFRTDHCGYWLRGIERDERGWLAREDDGSSDWASGMDEALSAWRNGDSLPEGWFWLGYAFAERAWSVGTRCWGERWYEEGDSSTYDVVTQLALLGEIRYS